VLGLQAMNMNFSHKGHINHGMQKVKIII
jgi:hypothetical protein